MKTSIIRQVVTQANRGSRLFGSAFLAASLASALLPLNAQDAPPADERVTILSPFEVESTIDRGYTSTNAATGFKTNQVLLQIPQAVTLVTRDLIEDIGYTDSSDVLQFAGVTPFYKGESFAIRGSRILFALVDDVPDALPFADNAYVDSYTVLRGPSSTLYLNTSIGGTVLITTKKPLPTARYALTGKVDTEGLWRTEVDFTGPLGSLGNAKFSYRFVGTLQDGDSYLKNLEDERLSLHPTLQMNLNNTVVRFALDHHDIDHAANANNFLTPQGKLYMGAGRDEGYYVAGTMENHEMTRLRLEVLQKLTDNWDVKLAAQNWTYWRLGANVFPSAGINWPNRTVGLTARANDRGDAFRTVLADVIGKYHWLGRSMESAFGAAYAEQSGESWIRATSSFGTKLVSIDNPQLQNITAPRIGGRRGAGNAGDFPVTAIGARNTTYRGNGYFQQTVEVLPKRLTAIGGVTYSKIKTNDDRANSTQVDGNETLHRLGLVFNVTKDFVLYAMQSTTFSPQSQRDLNLNLIGNQEGEGKEAGLKTAFLDGRISSTLSFFRLELSNQAAFGGVRPDGTSYSAPLGSTIQEGYDLDLAVSPLPGWQLVAAFYNGKVRDRAGARVPNTYEQSISFFTRYEVQTGALRGLSFGGGYSRVNGRIIGGGGLVTGLTPAPTTLNIDPGNNVTLFATYEIRPHWLLRANVQNAFDETFAVGAQAAWLVDPSPPRMLSFSATYRF